MYILFGLLEVLLFGIRNLSWLNQLKPGCCIFNLYITHKPIVVKLWGSWLSSWEINFVECNRFLSFSWIKVCKVICMLLFKLLSYPSLLKLFIRCSVYVVILNIVSNLCIVCLCIASSVCCIYILHYFVKYVFAIFYSFLFRVVRYYL